MKINLWDISKNEANTSGFFYNFKYKYDKVEIQFSAIEKVRIKEGYIIFCNYLFKVLGKWSPWRRRLECKKEKGVFIKVIRLVLNNVVYR